jgi:hypothetical protein
MNWSWVAASAAGGVCCWFFQTLTAKRGYRVGWKDGYEAGYDAGHDRGLNVVSSAIGMQPGLMAPGSHRDCQEE